MEKKYVYGFDEGQKEMRSLLGGKGANLAEMTRLGINVPYGFTVTTEACIRYYDENGNVWDGLLEEIKKHVEKTEKELGKKFGDNTNPLLFSVRSGAVISMPGMMDTVLNLGLTDESVEGLAKHTENPRFAYDSYRRFIQMFSDVSKGVDKELFEDVLTEEREKAGVQLDKDIPAESLKEVVRRYKEIYKKEVGEDFPQDPFQQLLESVTAVFKSWNNERAILYRKLNNIPHDLGTAVNVQSMVFGNGGDNSGTGVAFTRNPSTGENELFGEYLINAQGEDVVAGIRTPEHISHLQDQMPEVYDEFFKTGELLERHYRDMQDLEFTIEDGKLFILQTRSGKRTAQAAVNIAVDLVEEGLRTKEEALMMIEPTQLDQLLHPKFDAEALEKAEVLTKGLAASPGAATGYISFSANDAMLRNAKEEPVILVRTETSPEDLQGMDSAKGILTSRGGMTSHAAVVARGMGKCCVAGAHEVKVDEVNKVVTVGDIQLGEGDMISLDGSTGTVYKGKIETIDPELSGKFATFMSWADEVRRLQVRANADTPHDAQQALDLGAEGVGLCRTEHMFFAEDRINAVREMILSKSREQREKALAKIEPVQEQDFYDIYKVMDGRNVTIRLLDPPLHEFVPHTEEDIAIVANELGVTILEQKKVIDDLHEVNPMLGHRGLRLAITFPEIYQMQARAIAKAAVRVAKEGIEVRPEIMIPLAGDAKELEVVANSVRKEIDKVFEEEGMKLEYHVGTMIEIPRATLLADEIAEVAEFFSFGTNDLTQLTYGFSRDDAGKFLTQYLDDGIFEKDPFQVLDQKGVGKLMINAVKLGKQARKNIKLGICGEHGGEPSSVAFCDELGLDYVSCSPFRVPISRLAAAQKSIRDKQLQMTRIIDLGL
ncbi:pyruvate, phosphate dikinase [Helcococcus sueciensis]|uniref:pyruvate, phosphate dikinase n=1 Tax=Helcococcus sueciensis TaxID=241555 RepID=UPI000405FDEB|nr:pyruvate, phosphate dikinase [Helcococcus sueciensis]